jgi:hypothetical protein
MKMLKTSQVGNKNASKISIKDDMGLESFVVDICHRHQLFTAQDLVDTGEHGLLSIGFPEETIDSMNEWINRETGLWIED